MSIITKWADELFGITKIIKFSWGFIREQAVYSLDEDGSQIDITQTFRGDVPFKFTRVMNQAREHFNIPACFIHPGWCIYVESKQSVWLFNGINQIEAITINGRFTVATKEDLASCPEAVMRAIPVTARLLLVDQRRSLHHHNN